MKLLFENWRGYLKEQTTEASKDLRDLDRLDNQTIIVIGDSQSLAGPKGWRNPNKPHSSWGRDHMGRYLVQLLKDRGANVIILPRGGWGSRSWNKKLNDRYLKYLKDLKPSQIIVNLGQNDSGRSTRYFDKHTTPLMQKLKSINTNITWFGPSHISTVNNKKRKAFENVDTNLRSRADIEGIAYIPMLNWMDEVELFKGKDIDQLRYDAAHFKGEPARHWAEAINKKILSQQPTQIELPDTPDTPVVPSVDIEEVD